MRYLIVFLSLLVAFPCYGKSFQFREDGDVLRIISDDPTEGSTITDSSIVGRAVSTNSGVTHDTAQSKFGGSSLLFTAASSNYVSWADSADWDVGGGNFIIDFQVKRASIGSRQALFGQSNSAGTNNTLAIDMEFTATNTVTVYLVNDSGITVDTLTSSAVTDTSSFHYIKLTKVGNIVYLYIDDVEEDTGDLTGVTLNNSANEFAIGRFGELDSLYFDGWIDEFRFVKGVGDATTTVPQRQQFMRTTL